MLAGLLTSGKKMNSTVNPSKPRILFVNRSYWPDAEATGQLLTDLCQSLVDQFDVSVLCGQPNSNPGNSTYTCSGEQSHAGVTIHRLPHTQFNKRRGGGRIANLISFTLAVRRWLATSARYDIVVSETDPFLLPIVVAPYAKRTGASFVAYLQDIYPDIAIRLGKAKDGIVTRQLRNRLRSAYQSAKKVIVLSPAMKAELVGWGLDGQTIDIVPNWVDCEAVVPMKEKNPFRWAHGWQNDFVVMHSGNMGLSQRLDALIDAVRDPRFPARAKLVLIGGGADEVRLKDLAAKSPRARDIHFLPYQSREGLSASLSAADLHVISVDPRIGGTMMPSKLYGILASATPVMAIADAESDVAKIVLQNDVGIVADQHDPAKIAAAVEKMANLSSPAMTDITRRARALAESHFDKRICVERFASMLHHLRTPIDPFSNEPLAIGSRAFASPDVALDAASVASSATRTKT